MAALYCTALYCNVLHSTALNGVLFQCFIISELSIRRLKLEHPHPDGTLVWWNVITKPQLLGCVVVLYCIRGEQEIETDN